MTPQSNLSLIVAVAENGAIGKNNDLLWHISADLKHFKALTTGHCIIMGRKTYESFPKRPLPNLIRKFTGSEPQFDFVSGFNELPRPLAEYKMVIQCGGCVVTGQQLESRLRPAIEAGIPVSNYGMAIAFMTGIFDRAVKVFRS